MMLGETGALFRAGGCGRNVGGAAHRVRIDPSREVRGDMRGREGAFTIGQGGADRHRGEGASRGRHMARGRLSRAVDGKERL